MGIIGDILYFLFPFPPAIWRTILLISFVSVFLVGDKTIQFSLFDKANIAFLVINWIYFLAAKMAGLADSFSLIITITIALLSFSTLKRLGQMKLLTQTYITVSAVSITIVCIPFYYHELQQLYLIYDLSDHIGITVNASSLFLFCLPFVFIFKKRLLSFIIIFTALYFIVISVKRGNIIGAILPIFLYVLMIIKKTKRNIIILSLSTFIFLFLTNQLIQIAANNEYFMSRLEMTEDGDSSGRDIIYEQLWLCWKRANFLNSFFGFGWNGTIQANDLQLYAHSDWLEALIDLGVMGVFIYAMIFLSLIMLIFRANNIDAKFCLISILSIWLLKATFSMGYLEEYLCIMAIPFGYSVQILNKKSKND